MASRTANIKVTLSTSAFTGEMKKTERQVAQSGKRMGQKLGKEMDNGFKKGQKALLSMGKSMGRMIKQVGTLGAAFATGALVRDSVEIHKKFQDISFLLSRFPDQAKSWQEVQNMITGAANRTTRTTMEMAGAFEQVYKDVGDASYAAESLDMIGRAATATGAPVEQLATVAGMIKRKWGLTGKAAEEAMAQFVEGSNRGGLSLDSLSSRLDLVAGEAAEMGLDISELLGTISRLDDVMGEMAPRGIKTMLMYMKEGTTQAKELEKAGRFKFTPDMDALDRIRMIIDSPKAQKVALKTFTDTSRTAFDELRKPFVETLEASKKAGDTDKIAHEKAMAAFDKMVGSIRKTEMTASDLDRMYSKRVQEDPSVKLRIAINKVRDAFAQPKMIDAIGKLADKLPGLAKVVADIIGFIVDNPMGAAGVGLGLRVGAPMLAQGMMFRGSSPGFGKFSGEASNEAAMKNMGRGGAGGRLGGGIGGAARGAAGGVGGLGKAAGTATGNVKGMGIAAGDAIGQFAGAGAIGYTLGKIVENQIDQASEALDAWGNLRQEAITASEGHGSKPKTVEEHEKAVTELEKTKGKAKKEYTRDRSFAEMGLQASKLIFDPENAFNAIFDRKALTKTIEDIQGKTEFKSTTQLIDKRIDEHYAAIGKMMEAQYKASESLSELGDAAKNAKQKLEGAPTGGSGKGGARGSRKGLPSVPGAEPKSG